MRDITEIFLASVTLAIIATLVVNGQGTATAAQGILGGWAGVLRAATYQGAGAGFGNGF